MHSEVFLDTSFALALSAPSDRLHHRALYLAKMLQAAETRLVTTQAVMLEIGNALSQLPYRQAAIILLNSLVADSKVEIVPLSQELYKRAFQLYCDRTEKEWGFVDCVSFIVMEYSGITEALTADEHFQQAGFRALLRENLP
ncbi:MULTISPECIES: type II toxin-antitoxin system VapC family toxin [Nostoc]|uniref:Type II toxin-antitoxin system VapC family toxin n=1 Tax=Nostoc paludosum FACHB-159 TaxID=2692908 RepID=A0ABR8KBG0_9NOSO|nr:MULTISPECIES: PIN domain-containing protein [Nostoc]MBD2679930.1 type II toxin-antitoxin system VapC family toxin [Nostoc sp. FACHB-857]MBD2736184.1 type II toxin-antitoxin system VapC family toxin [Nostoc paludosum FACHB-159]